jgi:hypothetical protein
MSSVRKRVIVVLICASSITSCAPEQRDQAIGGLLGAAVGAGTGALAGGGDGKAIAAGALAGAAVGWAAVALTQYHARQVRSASQEVSTLGYEQSQGTLVRIRSANSAPAEVRPGDQVTLSTDYTVLAPASSQVPVKEGWELWKDNKALTKMPAKQAVRDPGGWDTRASIEIPQGATPGTYVVKHRVECGTSYDERNTFFVVSDA